MFVGTKSLGLRVGVAISTIVLFAASAYAAMEKVIQQIQHG